MLKFSKKFRELLERVSYNKVSNHLMNIGRLSKDSFDYNYICISDTNRLVSFTPSDKVEKILSELPEVFGVKQIRNLTHSNSNDTIFRLIGYDKSDNEYWYPQPSCQCNEEGEPMEDGRPPCGCNKGDTGTILNEVVSPSSGKTYVLFKCLDTGRLSVVNKEAVVESNNSDVIFTVNRNSIKVGRLVTNILTTAGVKFVAKDVEDFVNLYKASYDFATNKDIQFKIVSGESIPYWYRKERYVRTGGQLSNSCMAEKSSEIFDIYSKNSCCSMVILYSDDGILKQGSYESNKIKGRALLWDVVYNGQNIKFLDRIYCNADSDVELFKTYAKNKGWYRKVEQSMYPETKVTINGSDQIKDRFEIALDVVPKYFPYMDTMCFYVEEDGKCIITNDNKRGHTREFRCTGGNYIEIEDGRERGYSNGAENDGYLEEGECDMNEPVEVEMPIEEELLCNSEAPEPAVMTAHQVPTPVRMAADFNGTMATEQAIGRATRYTVDVETGAMGQNPEVNRLDMERVREMLMRNTMIPRERFDEPVVESVEEEVVEPACEFTSTMDDMEEEAYRNMVDECGCDDYNEFDDLPF